MTTSKLASLLKVERYGRGAFKEFKSWYGDTVQLVPSSKNQFGALGIKFGDRNDGQGALPHAKAMLWTHTRALLAVKTHARQGTTSAYPATTPYPSWRPSRLPTVVFIEKTYTFTECFCQSCCSYKRHGRRNGQKNIRSFGKMACSSKRKNNVDESSQKSVARPEWYGFGN